MDIQIHDSPQYHRIVLNAYRPTVPFVSGESNEVKLGGTSLSELYPEIEITEERNSITISLPLEIGSHILGLGEKAFGLDRKRKRLVCINQDPGGYVRGKDPTYFPIPFFIKIHDGESQGIFVNFPGEVVFDFGVETYDRTRITVKNNAAEIFIFKSGNAKDVVHAYITLTGKPFLPPKWALGHAISRYASYPEREVMKILDSYQSMTRVDAFYLDIDFMDHYRLFTWNRKIFNGTFIEDMHRRGIRVITIVNPSIKLDQNYDVFRAGLGHFVETPSGDIYTGKMWPGTSAFPDFLNLGARNFWKKEIRKWASQGVDGIWLDMNEPTILTEDHLFDGSTLHHLDDDSTREHREVRNSYPYYQNMATYEALAEKIEKPFILTRSGYAGVQKFAAVWTGDNVSSWDDVRLQISMVTSLSISGIVFVGCDLGGFLGDSTPHLLSAYYKMALLFPLYRNHKDARGNDQEIFLQPSYARKEVLESIDMRYKFMDYLYSLMQAAHEDGSPVVTPLPYEFPDDEDSFHVDDEYMLGGSLLYAPQINEGEEERTVYLPPGEWVDLWSREKLEGRAYVKTGEHYPMFLKRDSCIIFENRILVFGKGTFRLFVNDGEVSVVSDGNRVSVRPQVKGYEPELL